MINIYKEKHWEPLVIIIGAASLVNSSSVPFFNQNNFFGWNFAEIILQMALYLQTRI